tara:strand:- start:67 stop:759 length:693 start_codon:yes stop_codon:yes gene_type:complete
MAKYYKVTITTQLLSTFKVTYSTNSNPTVFDHTAGIWDVSGAPYTSAINLNYNQLTDNGGLIVVVDDDVYRIKIEDENGYCTDCVSDASQTIQLIDLWGGDVGTYDYGYIDGDTTLRVEEQDGKTYIRMRLYAYTENMVDEYKVYVYLDGVLFYESDALIGSGFSLNISGTNSVSDKYITAGDYVTYIQSQNSISFSKLEWHMSYYPLPPDPPSPTGIDIYKTIPFITNI